MTNPNSDPVARCPVKGCARRYRGGPDRLCAAHQDQEPPQQPPAPDDPPRAVEKMPAADWEDLAQALHREWAERRIR